MSEDVTATEMMERAWLRRRRDLQAQRLVDMAVGYVMNQHSHDGDRTDPLRLAHECATEAAMIIYEKLFSDDQRLRQLEAERDHIRKVATDAISSRMPVVVVPA